MLGCCLVLRPDSNARRGGAVLSKLLRLRQGLWDARQSPVIYFVVLFFLGMSINLVSAEPWLPAVRRVMEWVPPLAVLLLLLTPAARRFWPWGTVEPNASVFEAGSCRGLVVFASPGPGIATARKAISYHTTAGKALEKVWIFCSDFSVANAETLAANVAEEWPDIEAGLVKMSDAGFQDVETVQEKIESIVYGCLREKGWLESDVVIDFTGGAKTTTAGAILAGLPAARRMEFVPAEKKNEAGYGLDAGNPREVQIDYRMRRIRST
jgi:hypothetical protein